MHSFLPIDEGRFPRGVVSDEHDGDLLAGSEEGEVQVLGDRHQPLVLVRVQAMCLLAEQRKNIKIKRH